MNKTPDTLGAQVVAAPTPDQRREALEDMEGSLGPRPEYRVTAAEDAEDVAAEMAARGMRLSCISNAGLPRAQVRATFLPESEFTDGKTALEARNGDRTEGRHD